MRVQHFRVSFFRCSACHLHSPISFARVHTELSASSQPVSNRFLGGAAKVQQNLHAVGELRVNGRQLGGFVSTVLSKTFLLSTMPSWLLRQGNGYVYEEASNEKYLAAAICIWQTSIKALSTCLMVFAHALGAHYPQKNCLMQKVIATFCLLGTTADD